MLGDKQWSQDDRHRAIADMDRHEYRSVSAHVRAGASRHGHLGKNSVTSADPRAGAGWEIGVTPVTPSLGSPRAGTSVGLLRCGICRTLGPTRAGTRCDPTAQFAQFGSTGTPARGDHETRAPKMVIPLGSTRAGASCLALSPSAKRVGVNNDA